MTVDGYNLGVIRESRTDEFRAPLVPSHIKKIKKLFSGIRVIVQPSDKRCFSNEEYLKAGAIINEDLASSDLILGIKEIDTSILINSKKYLFFSHTSKIQSDNSAPSQGAPGVDKKKLLNAILKKDITLIDYENIRNKKGSRYLGFGRFAGIVGCYNSLALYEDFSNNIRLPRAFEINDYSLLKDTLQDKKFSEIKILITGDGRVARGALELLKFTNINQVSKDNFIKNTFNEPVFCNLETSDYVSNDSGKAFSLQHFIKNPTKYSCVAEKYLEGTNLLIGAHYWDPLSPKIFDLKNLHRFNKLKVIGDITCDINGSIPTTLRSTSIKNPYFYFNKDTKNEINKSDDAIAIMAVDNLPSELPRDSSEEFGDGIIREVLPYIINNDDDDRIHNATIIKRGNFLSKYSYLKNYISK